MSEYQAIKDKMLRDEPISANDAIVYAQHQIKEAIAADEAYEYAKRLAYSIGSEHWPENTDWKPLPTLLGVLTQIDNMTTLMRDQKAEIARWRALLRKIDAVTVWETTPLGRGFQEEIERALSG